MIIVCVIIAAIAVVIAVYMVNMEKYCNCAAFGTQKVLGSPPYYTYSPRDIANYGGRDVQWPVGTPYDIYARQYREATKKQNEAYALDACGVKLVKIPPSPTVYSPSSRRLLPTYVSTPEGCRVPIMSDGLPPIAMNPAGSFDYPVETTPSSCASFSPYNLAIGVL